MLNVLVVDDALVIRKNITRFLTDLGHKVISDANSGAQAVEICKENKDINLITMDITMPEMNGIEATKLIKEILPDVSIIMVTSHGQEELVSQSLKAGAKNFVLKPITKEKLEKTIGALFPEYAKEEDDELLDEE
ncbi:response regulator [Arcobacter sp. LA11]|uniref:response regulator n=1 Tax=Arcobacter sp. LA11 TaxID=1898176 RepID=UPI000935467C|nr:response regulator [Arcobacter sp. LA11]